jgi:hypothetical protein
MNTTPPPPALALLFPELPAWALAPFLAAPYLEVPFEPRTKLSIVGTHLSGDSSATTWDWLIQIRRGHNNTLEAQLLFGGFLTGQPFGADSAQVTLTPDDTPTTSPWKPAYKGSPLYKAQIHQDLLLRWHAITDPTAQQEILKFWLGHELPALAELGMAVLQHNQLQHTDHLTQQGPR